MVSFAPRPLYLQGKSPWYPLDRRLLEVNMSDFVWRCIINICTSYLRIFRVSTNANIVTLCLENLMDSNLLLAEIKHRNGRVNCLLLVLILPVKRQARWPLRASYFPSISSLHLHLMFVFLADNVKFVSTFFFYSSVHVFHFL
jgi:hypothetical protein